MKKTFLVTSAALLLMGNMAFAQDRGSFHSPDRPFGQPHHGSVLREGPGYVNPGYIEPYDNDDEQYVAPPVVVVPTYPYHRSCGVGPIRWRCVE